MIGYELDGATLDRVIIDIQGFKSLFYDTRSQSCNGILEVLFGFAIKKDHIKS